jgi:hypothetical protein
MYSKGVVAQPLLSLYRQSVERDNDAFCQISFEIFNTSNIFFETGRTPLENCLPWHYDDYLFLLPLFFSGGLKKGTLFHFVLIV